VQVPPTTAVAAIDAAGVHEAEDVAQQLVRDHLRRDGAGAI
jgi:hypothetical protein